MKGIIFNLLENLILEKFGDDLMEEIYADVNFSSEVPPFVGPETYPDSDLLAIIGYLSEKINLSPDKLVFEFGKYMFPVLADKYPVFFEGINEPIAFLKNVDGIIHVEVKKLFEGANPPSVLIEQISSNKAILTYISTRRLCKLVEGMLEGVASHFNQKVIYSHKQCLNDGADKCIFDIEFK